MDEYSFNLCPQCDGVIHMESEGKGWGERDEKKVA